MLLIGAETGEAALLHQNKAKFAPKREFPPPMNFFGA
jgi:hypothetical protein